MNYRRRRVLAPWESIRFQLLAGMLLFIVGFCVGLSG